MQRTKKRSNEAEEVRSAMEDDLYTFACIVNPTRLYGDVHKEVFRWLMASDPLTNQLLLLARGHMKSHMLAVWCAWQVTKYPETTILYISATSTLAEDQLYAIKNMMDSDIYKTYWPAMLHTDVGMRERWSVTNMSVDHPQRKLEGVRDATIRCAGLTTNTAGLHADIIVADDIVVPENAYTADGRRKTAAAMSQMSSIKNAGGMIKACGTTYHPDDIYTTWKDQKVPIVDDEGNITDEKLLWEVFELPVETKGQFSWPRAARSDGKWFGFNHQILAQIRTEYLDGPQFFAQYYLNPNDPGSNRVGKDRFQYFDHKHIKYFEGKYWFKDKPLNLYASIDFAFSLKKAADYTAIVVVAIDSDGFIYVVDMDRFRTDRINDYFERICALHSKWGFRKLRAECTAAQSIIAQELKDRIRQEGMSISVDEYRPNRSQGSKEERIAALLEPRYENLTIFHSKGGYTSILEEELILSRPRHDDLKDALASVVEIAVKPKYRRNRSVTDNNVVNINSKFGGCAF